jgi:hypothetical protein
LLDDFRHPRLCQPVHPVLAEQQPGGAAVAGVARQRDAPVVGAAAAMWAARRSEPIVAKSVAADVIISGTAITYDISHLLGHPQYVPYL